MAAGHVLGGKYRLVRLLGRGSMGEVWSARHLTLDEHVAVKLLTPDADVEGPDERARAAARFRFEAQVAARLSRKTRHIVRVTDHGEEGGVAYLVMELLEGKTLAEQLLLRGTLPPAEVARIVVQAARGLEVAHAEGIVHRDLKPANVFLTRDEDGWLLAKVLDFGIARTIHTHRVALPFATGTAYAAGTPGYMGPQQARGGRPDPRFDLWALAAVAYEALTGELPIPGRATGELFDNACAGRVVPLRGREATLVGGLTAFFERAFAPRPEDRYASASEIAVAFERAIGAGAHGSGDRSLEAPPLPSRGSTVRMQAPALAAAGRAPRSAGTPRTETVAIAPPVTRRRSAGGSGLAIAGSLLLAAATAGVAHTWREAPPPRSATVAAPATNAILPGAASAPATGSAEPPADPTAQATLEAARVVVKTPPARPRVPAATTASAAVVSATQASATPKVIDRSATF